MLSTGYDVQKDFTLVRKKYFRHCPKTVRSKDHQNVIEKNLARTTKLSVYLMLVACSALYICATNMEYVYTKFPW